MFDGGAARSRLAALRIAAALAASDALLAWFASVAAALAPEKRKGCVRRPKTIRSDLEVKIQK